MSAHGNPAGALGGDSAAASAAASRFNPGMYYMQPGGMAPGRWPAPQMPQDPNAQYRPPQ